MALLDKAAILTCSVYVDLNPIRAGLATTPEDYIMLLDWTGRELRADSAGRSPIIWLRSWSDWRSIARTGWKPCAGSADCSSRRRGDRVRSSMRPRAARGAGSRARRRLEPLLCRRLAQRRVINTHLHHLSLGERGHLTRNTLRGAVSTGRTVQLRTSNDRARTSAVSIGCV